MNVEETKENKKKKNKKKPACISRQDVQRVNAVTTISGKKQIHTAIYNGTVQGKEKVHWP